MDKMDVLEFVYGGESHQRRFEEMKSFFGPTNAGKLLKIINEISNKKRPWLVSEGNIYTTTNHAPIADLKKFKK